MKKDKLQKKLLLNKETITPLNPEEMKVSRGGAIITEGTCTADCNP